jgi:hypothetical protein
MNKNRTIRSVLREVLQLLREAFTPAAGRFLPFEGYPSRFRPPMKKSERCNQDQPEDDLTPERPASCGGRVF